MAERFTKLPDRIVDGATLGFALWTVCCNVTAAFGGNAYVLLVVAVTAFAATAALIARRRGPSPNAAPAHAELTPDTGSRTVGFVASAIGLLLALAIAFAWWRTHDGMLVWGAACVFFLGSSVWLLSRPLVVADVAGAALTAREALLLVALGAIGAVSTLLMHLPNTDDVVYVNIAVAVADHPGLELFAHDTIHDAGVPLLAVYAVHSFELLGGIISLVTRIPALYVIHLGLATIAGFLTPLAWGRLFRLLEPRRWLWLVAIVVSLYLFDGSETRSFAMHAFVRIFQGKAIQLSMAVPLITANAIAFSLAPSRRALLLLAASVIAGIGLSSTGLWLAPMVAATGLAVTLTPRLSSLRTLAIGMASCAYPVVVGVWVRALMAAQRAAFAAPAAADAVAPAKHVHLFTPLAKALVITLGNARIATAYAACVLLAWPLAHTQLAKRYLVAFSAIGVVLLFNPWLVEFMQANVTGRGTYSRVLWFLPVPAAFALCFASPIAAHASRRVQLIGAAVACAALVAFYVKIPTHSVLTAGRLELSLRPKVDRDAYEVALFLRQVLPRESRVLVPHEVSLDVPMTQHHPYPIMTKPILFKRDRGARFALRKVVDGGTILPANRQAWFAQGLNRYEVSGVALDPRAESPMLASTLRSLGFGRVRAFPHYVVWTRRLSGARAAHHARKHPSSSPE